MEDLKWCLFTMRNIPILNKPLWFFCDINTCTFSNRVINLYKVGVRHQSINQSIMIYFYICSKLPLLCLSVDDLEKVNYHKN